MRTKPCIALLAVGAAAIIVCLIFQQNALKRLHTQNVDLRQQLETFTKAYSSTGENKESSELVRLRAEHEELLRLRGEVGPLRRERDELLRNVALAASKTNDSKVAAAQEADLAWVKQMLNSRPAQQGAVAGAMRGKLLRNQSKLVSASDLALRDALLERQLNQTLERSPADFAEFQSAFIQAAVGIDDAAKVEQIRQLIQQTYEQAIAQSLDIPSKPATDTEAWVQHRHQLDREATAAVQQLLTSEQRRFFDRAFLGVMGVDLGGVGVDRSNYPAHFLGGE